MTPELTERFKVACKLMAEKMPEKLKYEEDEFGWTLYNFSQEECYVNLVLPKDKVYVFQDDIDVLASLLPEPRRILIMRWEDAKKFSVRFYDMEWRLVNAINNNNISEKLDLLIWGFCAEIERQLK